MQDHPTVARDLEFTKLVWAVPLAIIIHNGEEALTMPAWMAAHLPTLYRSFDFLPHCIPTPDDYYRALTTFTAMVLLVALIAFLSGPRSLGLYLLAGIQGIMLANAFVPHLIATIVSRKYTPGIITASLVIIPFSLFWFRRILQRGFVQRRPLIISIVIGTLVYPLAMLALYKSSGC